jgi:predicted nucleic acid-binding protein
MRVIADASPLRYLILIWHIDLLSTLFSQIIVPRAVADELQRPNTPPVVRQWLQHLPPWCLLRVPQQRHATALEELGAGEREALLLAQELQADLVLIDEDKGRRVARALGLALTGTLGVLEQAAERGLIDLPSALIRLQETDFYVTSELIEVMLERDAARKRQTSRPDHAEENEA